MSGAARSVMSNSASVKIIGHRGGKLVWPENGLTGFRAVTALGIDGVEFDVHPSSDGDLFVIHDPTLERTTEAAGPVSARSSTELRAVALRGGGGDTVPTLDAVLDVLGPPGLELHVEIKLDAQGHRYAGVEARVLAALDRRGLAERAVVTSFSPDVLVALRRLAPKQRLLASINQRSADALGGFDRALAKFAAIPIDFFAVEKTLLTTTLAICQHHFKPEQLVAWVVNEADELAHWLTQSIGWIDSDRPDLALATRRGLAAAKTR